MIDSPSQFSRHRAFISPSASAPSFPTFARSPSPSPSPNPNFPQNSRSSSSAPSSFSHNARIAAALLPSAAFLLSLGGSPVAVVLSLGLALSYILDSLRLSTAAFFSLWFSLIASQFAFFFSAAAAALSASLPLTLLTLLFSAFTTFLIGVWFSINFKWIQIQNPSMVKTLERLLFSCLPISTPCLFTWAVVSALGFAHAAYYLMAFACVFYWVFSIPRKSGFGEEEILTPLECCVHTLYLLFVPVLFRIGSHHAVAFSSFAGVCDLLLLFFVPFLFQLYASTRGALWWVTRDAYQVQRLRVVNGAVAMVVVVICLEVRVVFHSFGRYVQVPPPLNYFLVTVTMLGGALGCGAFAVGMVGSAVSEAAFTVLAVLCSGAGAIVIGFPILVCFSRC